MAQRRQLDRIMIIDWSIRNKEYPNAKHLGEMLEVSRWMVFNSRDFMISCLGPPIKFDRLYGGWFYAEKT